jgi:hypothetical protein
MSQSVATRRTEDKDVQVYTVPLLLRALDYRDRRGVLNDESVNVPGPWFLHSIASAQAKICRSYTCSAATIRHLVA